MTAVEGLMEDTFDGDMPLTLKDVALYTLDMETLVAGAQCRGEFEE